MHHLLAGLLGSLLMRGALAQFGVASKPFALVVESSNSTLNGSLLLACHEGAAIEGLCPTYTKLSTYQANSSLSMPTFTFNTSETSGGSTSGTDQDLDLGLVVFLLRGGNFNLSSPLKLSYSPVSNVAIPLFTPSDGDQFAFNKNNELGVQWNVDDTVVPIINNRAFFKQSWYICETYWGYRYTTLAWKVGVAQPQNPTCQSVCVKRVFV